LAKEIFRIEIPYFIHPLKAIEDIQKLSVQPGTEKVFKDAYTRAIQTVTVYIEEGIPDKGLIIIGFDDGFVSLNIPRERLEIYSLRGTDFVLKKIRELESRIERLEQKLL